MFKLSRFMLIFVLISIIILVINNTIYYLSTKQLLQAELEDRMKSVAKLVRISIDHSELGKSFVEDLIGVNLRTAAIASQFALDPDIEKVSNDQLKQLRDMLGINEMTLLKKQNDDIVGYKSSNPDEIGISTKGWEFWFTALQQLMDKQEVTVPEGQKLSHYWSGPVEVSTSNPKNIDKWGYYYDGTTNYIIDPYVHNDLLAQYDQLVGPTAVFQRILDENPLLKELTVFNHGVFGTKPEISKNKNNETWYKLSQRQILFGTYSFKDERDVKSVNEAAKRNQLVSYTALINGKKMFKSFIPVTSGNSNYVIGTVADYSVIQGNLNKQFLCLGIVMAIASLISVFVFLLTFRMFKSFKEDAVQTAQETYIQEVNDMFTTIRGQRHDFLNHVQTMHTLIQMGKIDDLKQYAAELVGDIRQVNEMIQIGHPAIAALIQSKLVSALDKKIQFSYEATDLSKLSLGGKSVDIVKIIGNLLDNAFDEVVKLPVEERKVSFGIQIEKGNLCIRVNNPGRLISQTELTQMFQVGFSTKDNEKHSGLGLAITKERVKYYKGRIYAESDAVLGITFFVTMPMDS